MSKAIIEDLIDEQTSLGSSAVISAEETSPSETENVFHFWNGDTYAGQFSFLKDKQTIAMDGQGVYRTSDGQTYDGFWENDDLKDVCKIVFTDESKFFGTLHEMMMEGPGKYKFKENVEIEGDMIENSLFGKVNLVDPNGHTWRGEAKKEDRRLQFFPLHPFWQSVLHSPLKFEPFYGEAEEENENVLDWFQI